MVLAYLFREFGGKVLTRGSLEVVSFDGEVVSFDGEVDFFG